MADYIDDNFIDEASIKQSELKWLQELFPNATKIDTFNAPVNIWVVVLNSKFYLLQRGLSGCFEFASELKFFRTTKELTQWVEQNSQEK